MGTQGAIIRLKSCLTMVNSFHAEANLCVVTLSQLELLKNSLNVALAYLQDKPKTCQYQALNNAYAQSLGSRNPVPFSPPVKRARLTPTVEPPISKASNKAEEVHTKVEEAIDIWDEPDLDDPTPSESLDDPTPLESLEDTIFPDLVDDPSSAEPLVDLMPPDPATSSIPSTVPTNQNYLELLPNPYLEISPELKDLLLWLNGQPLCHRAHDPSLPPDFDVLRGYPRHYYGLFPSKNWRYHLTYLLMKLPHFRHNHSLFFASIFRQSPVYWNGKMLALKKIINGEHLSASHATICPKEKDFVALVQNPLIANQIDFGLSSSELERLRQQEEQVKQDSQPLPLEEVGEDLPEIELGIIEVEMLKTFGTIQFYAYNRCLLPAMKSEGCIGLMGLVKTGAGSLKGRMIVRHWQSSMSNPDQELSDLANLISQVFGLPRLAVFKWAEMVPESEGKFYIDKWGKTQRESLTSKANQTKLEAAFETMGNYGKHATHVDIHELNFGYKHTMALEVVEDMPWEEVKNMALVVRKSPTGLFGLKPLLNQDCLDKFLAQDRACPKIEAKRLTHTQFCRSMLEIFKWLVNVKSKDMVERFPTFGQEFRKIRGLWNMVRNANISQSLEPNSPKPFLASDKVQIKQCEYCGKTFHCVSVMDNTALAWHSRKCKLEKATCNCNIVFSSPREKRNHMNLKHSNGSYMKCEQCRYLSQDQKAMDSHVEHYHGFPGREEICSHCQKSFRCRNHLNQHHFTHEAHFCTPCGREFLGRLPFRRHMKSEHGAGFPCEACGKVIMTKKELEKHMKLKHFNAIWMS